MKFVKSDLWEELATGNYDAVLIPTNGCYSFKTNEAVMGAGVAKQAKEKFPGIEKKLGFFLDHNSKKPDPQWREPWNVPYCLGVYDNITVFSFPTKPTWAHRDDKNKNKHILTRYRLELDNKSKVPGWQAKSDLILMERSAELISKVCVSFNNIALPTVGTGHGELDPDDVVPVLQKYFDDRYTVIIKS